MKLSRIAAIAATVLAAGSALAAPIALKPGPVYVQFNNLEQAGLINTAGFATVDLGKLNGVSQTLTSGQNEFNWGVFNVSTIQAGAVSTDHEDISGGTPFFTTLDRWVNLKLVETRTFQGGVILTRYETRS